MLQCLVAFGDRGPLQVEGGDKTPTAAPAAQGGKMPSGKNQPNKPAIFCSFWLQTKTEAGMGFFFFLMLLMSQKEKKKIMLKMKAQHSPRAPVNVSFSCCSGSAAPGSGRAGLGGRSPCGDGSLRPPCPPGFGRWHPLHGWGRSSHPSSSSSSPSPPRDAGARARTGSQTTAEEEDEEEEEEAVAADDEGEEEGEEEAFQNSHRFLGCRLRWR